jgi:hypothetical protein
VMSHRLPSKPASHASPQLTNIKMMGTSLKMKLKGGGLGGCPPIFIPAVVPSGTIVFLS